jgi:hypothetical protein
MEVVQKLKFPNNSNKNLRTVDELGGQKMAYKARGGV